MGEIYNVSKQFGFHNPIHKFKNQNLDPITFINFKGPMHIYNNMKNGNASVEKIEENKNNLNQT